MLRIAYALSLIIAVFLAAFIGMWRFLRGPVGLSAAASVLLVSPGFDNATGNRL